MKKLNWKIRFKNPVFIAQLLLSILLPILAYFGMTMEEITSWSILGNLLLEAVKNPYVLGLIVVSVWNAVNDPTVSGVLDSKQALSYKAPKKDK